MSRFMLGRKILTPAGYAERDCILVQYRLPGLAHCYVICHEQRHEQSSGHLSPNARLDLLQFFYTQAQALAFDAVGDPEAFLFIQSGKSARKRPNFHAHVFVVRSRRQKALAYSFLGAKNLMQVLGLGISALFLTSKPAK